MEATLHDPNFGLGHLINQPVFAIADFTRFLLGWMPEHHKVNDYHLNITASVLKELHS